MNRLIIWLSAAIICLGFTACNDDNTENDAALTQQLMGSWQLISENDKSTNLLAYTFRAQEFIYSTSVTTENGMKAQTMTISGAWNVQKGVLQLNYDLESLHCEGYTASEEKQIYDGFYKENLLLKDMNNRKEPYGPTLTFGTQGNQETLTLSNIPGAFTRRTF